MAEAGASPTYPVVMCAYKRLERLSTTLRQLSEQVSCNAEVYIWNNSALEAPYVGRTISQYPSMAINLHNSKLNIGGFGRFYYAREIAHKYPAVIFIDDDVDLDPTCLLALAKEFRPRTIHSFFTFKFTSKRNFFDRNDSNPGEEVDYCGTGGMICDTSIFLKDGLFRCPAEYSFVEDVWLSFYASHVMGWKLYKSASPICIVPDEKNQYVHLRDTKQEFFSYLLDLGWDVPRSRLPLIRGKTVGSYFRDRQIIARQLCSRFATLSHRTIRASR